MSYITQGFALDFLRKQRKNISGIKNLSSFSQCAEDLLIHSGSLKPVNEISKSPLDQSEFETATEVCRRRLIRLYDKDKKWKGKLFASDPEGAQAVFMDLSDFPKLLPKLSSNFVASQSSQSSRCSTLSDLEIEIPITDAVRKRKAFEDLGSHSKKLRTDDLMENLIKSANDSDISPARLAAYLGYRAAYVHDRTMSNSFRELFQGESQLNKVDPTLALYLRERCQIGRSVYTDVRLLLKDHVALPPFGKLQSVANEIRPSLLDWEFGVRGNLRECVKSTLERIMLSNMSSYSASDIENGVVAKCFMGVDGSGGHSIYNSPSSLSAGVDTSHMLVAGFVIPSIVVNNASSTEVFTDKCCNSSFSERPLFIIPGAETRDRMKIIMEVFDEEIDSLTNSPLRLELSDRVSIECSVQVEVSQLDGKAIKTSTGLIGAYCTCCTVTEKEAKSVDRIKEGFTIDRNINELNELYMLLTDNSEEDVSVPAKQGDESTRKGLNRRPLSTSQNLTDNIPITHAYMRFLGYFEQLAYRVNAGVRVMGRGSRYTEGQKRRLDDTKVKFREVARNGPLHMRLDVPDSSGHGGTTDTAEMARNFFTQKNRTHFIDMIEGTVAEKEGFKKLHENVSIILRILVSKR